MLGIDQVRRLWALATSQDGYPDLCFVVRRPCPGRRARLFGCEGPLGLVVARQAGQAHVVIPKLRLRRYLEQHYWHFF